MTVQRICASRLLPVAAATLALVGAWPAAQASSHRDAPYITTQPKVDGADFYMFASYEPGRTGYVTLLANWLPLQDGYAGPNYFSLDPNALQRKDPFAVNLGTIFDLVNAAVLVITDPTLINAAPNTIDDKNVTTLVLEVHGSCLTAGT